MAKGEEVFSEGNTTITVWTLDDRPGIQTNIILERQDIFWHPNTYPEIEELQRALSSIPKKIEQEHNYNTFWNGPAFKVSVQKTSIVLLIKKGEANISFAQPEWESFRKMLNQALTQRDIPLRVATLKLQYGSSF